MLINNAGVMPIGSFLQQSEQAIRSAIEVNFYGVLNGCQLVLPEMVARRGGHIVNIASLAGMIAVPGQAVYAGTKFAVVGLSVALADEFASQGVEVSAVLPTFTNTELITGTHPSAAQKPVQPEQIAAAVVKVLDKPTTVVVGAKLWTVPGPDDTAARPARAALAEQEAGQRPRVLGLRPGLAAVLRGPCAACAGRHRRLTLPLTCAKQRG